MTKPGLIMGNIVFWLLWPILWVYLRMGKRTRLLLVCGDEFLLLKGWLGPGEWGLPGGGLHRHEDAQIGLLREVREETGLVLSKQAVTFAYEATETKYGLRFAYSLFTAELLQKPPITVQRGEIVAYSWQLLANTSLPLSPDAAKAVMWWQNKGN